MSMTECWLETTERFKSSQAIRVLIPAQNTRINLSHIYGIISGTISVLILFLNIVFSQFVLVTSGKNYSSSFVMSFRKLIEVLFCFTYPSIAYSYVIFSVLQLSFFIYVYFVVVLWKKSAKCFMYYFRWWKSFGFDRTDVIEMNEGTK